MKPAQTMKVFVAVSSIVACGPRSSSAPVASGAIDPEPGVAPMADAIRSDDEDRVVADGACWEVPSGDDDSRWVFVYRGGHLIQIERRAPGREPEVKTAFEYDAAGRRLMERTYLYERVEEARVVYWRDDAGRLTKEEIFSEDRLISTSTMSYDAKGHLATETLHEPDRERTYDYLFAWQPHGDGGWEVTFESRMRDAGGPWSEGLSGRVVIDKDNRATMYEEMSVQNNWVWDERGRCIASETRDKYGRTDMGGDTWRLEPGKALHEGVLVLERAGFSATVKREVDDRGNFSRIDGPEHWEFPRFEYDGDFRNMICGEGRWVREPRTWRQCRLPNP